MYCRRLLIISTLLFFCLAVRPREVTCDVLGGGANKAKQRFGDSKSLHLCAFDTRKHAFLWTKFLPSFCTDKKQTVAISKYTVLKLLRCSDEGDMPVEAFLVESKTKPPSQFIVMKSIFTLESAPLDQWYRFDAEGGRLASVVHGRSDGQPLSVKELRELQVKLLVNNYIKSLKEKQKADLIDQIAEMIAAFPIADKFETILQVSEFTYKAIAAMHGIQSYATPHADSDALAALTVTKSLIDLATQCQVHKITPQNDVIDDWRFDAPTFKKCMEVLNPFWKHHKGPSAHIRFVSVSTDTRGFIGIIIEENKKDGKRIEVTHHLDFLDLAEGRTVLKGFPNGFDGTHGLKIIGHYYNPSEFNEEITHEEVLFPASQFRKHCYVKLPHNVDLFFDLTIEIS